MALQIIAPSVTASGLLNGVSAAIDPNNNTSLAVSGSGSTFLMPFTLVKPAA